MMHEFTPEKRPSGTGDNGTCLLSVKNLVIHYETEETVVEAANNVSFTIDRGETLGLVGETGAGKTTIALGIMRLLPEGVGRMIQGEIILDGQQIASTSKGKNGGVDEMEMRRIRGNKVSMIFQDPMTSLNPVLTVGDQIAEVIRQHNRISRMEAVAKAQEMLLKVGIPADRYHEYPHQFSGGMKQRVVIAIALACNPELLIADEPTTALDVTIQAQVLDLMRNLKNDFGTAMLLITHDLGVVAENCDKIAIIYAGEIVEFGKPAHIFKNPSHPYTVGLLESIPSLDKDVERLKPIPGLMPDPTNLPAGCSFCERCSRATEKCREQDPTATEIEPGHMVKCLYAGKRGEYDGPTA